MNPEFVEHIEHPESRYLQEAQQSAYDSVRERLNEHHMTEFPNRFSKNSPTPTTTTGS